MPRSHDSPTRADTALIGAEAAVVRTAPAAIRAGDGDPARGTERYGVAFTRRIR